MANVTDPRSSSNESRHRLITTVQSAVSIQSNFINEDEENYFHLYQSLLGQLIRRVSNNYRIDPFIPNDLNQSQTIELVEILKEKQRIIEELRNVVQSEDADEIENVFQINLKNLEDLVKSIQESANIRLHDGTIVKELEKTIEELEKKALSYQRAAEVANGESTAVQYRRNINQRLAEYKDMVNYVLKKLFPKNEDAVRCILNDLIEAARTDDPYINISDCDETLVEYLMNANIIETDPADSSKIKIIGIKPL